MCPLSKIFEKRGAQIAAWLLLFGKLSPLSQLRITWATDFSKLVPLYKTVLLPRAHE